MTLSKAKKAFKCSILLTFLAILNSLPLVAQLASNRYALILEDPPVSSKYTTTEAARSAEAKNYRGQIQSRQQTLRNELASRKVPVVGSADTLLNAIFVAASSDRVAELKSLPGVKAVVPLRRYRRNLNRAIQLVNVPAAWSALGGIPNAGAGIKIAILDSGIDQAHPAFQDSSLPMPAGFPIFTTGDSAFTNNKVIVARSYVRQLAAGSSPADSRPDDFSARDREGHGTAVASIAAGVTNNGTVTITGVAPKAYLGNYKIYGSPEVNDSTFDDVIIHALEDAVSDGMDIISFSSGGPAFTGPLDTGAACGNPAGVPCDLSALAFENAAKAGKIIVAAAGNEGEDGSSFPTFNSISSPADAPSVLAAGASTNSHQFLETVSVPGANAPPNLQNIATQSGDATVPTGAVTAPLVDVTMVGDNGLLCSALPDLTLEGTVALVERGSCNFSTKVANAENAGAVGAIIYMADPSPPVSPGGLSGLIPAVVISNSDGVALKAFIEANPYQQVTINPGAAEQSVSGFNQKAGWSSYGPATGTFGLKPDLVAVGTSMYMAAQQYDRLGGVYSSNGYAVASGTSFATPMVAGAAALVKQSHPGFSAAQVRSALVNTASQDVLTDDSGNPVSVLGLGGGKLDAGAAVGAAVTSNPATISFGVVQSLPQSQQIQITNGGSAAVNLSLAIAQASSSPAANLTLNPQSLSLAPGASGTVTVTLAGSVPAAGSYSGAVTIQGSGVSLRVPYLYLVGSGVAANIIQLTGSNFDGTAGQGIPEGIISFKLTDANGVPISGAPVTFTPRGGGTLLNADSTTDAYGIASAQPVLGSQPGSYSFTATAGGQRTTFSGFARQQPSITSAVNAASFEAGKPVAPGSYITLFGSGLSDFTDSAATVTPLAIDNVIVSFDVPSAGISVPGHPTYVSPGQVNVHVPWELSGQGSAQVKVTIDFSNGNIVTVPLAAYSPAFFEISGIAAALDTSFKVIGSNNPARRGQAISLFANGLGPVTNQPPSGDPAPSSPPFAETRTKPVVMIGGQSADVSFSGLAPGFAGLYQINVTVPSGLNPGTYAVTVAIGGQTSKASNIVVQ